NGRDCTLSDCSLPAQYVDTDRAAAKGSPNAVATMRDRQHASTSWVMSGVSEIAEARKEIEMLRHQLRQSQSLATLGELTGTATHEFNNLLMTVLNYAKMGLRYQDAATRD